MVRLDQSFLLGAEGATLASLPIQTMVQSLLRQIGEDPGRDGLIDTPKRFEKALKELTSGYSLSPSLAVGDGIFPAEGQGLVAVREIEFFSLCEHHMLPFWGHVSIAYLPGQKILGLSKLARVVEVFARRLQVQERLTREIAVAISELVDARGVVVMAQAQHMCMMMRGVRKNDSATLTEFSVGLDGITSEERDRLWKSIER
jgi:GTP cyclohydrolase I